MKAPSRSQMWLGPHQRPVPSYLGAPAPPPPHVPLEKRALNALRGASPGKTGRSPSGLPKPILHLKIPLFGENLPLALEGRDTFFFFPLYSNYIPKFCLAVVGLCLQTTSSKNFKFISTTAVIPASGVVCLE